jgi:hypothetical protein
LNIENDHITIGPDPEYDACGRAVVVSRLLVDVEGVRPGVEAQIANVAAVVPAQDIGADPVRS